MTAPAAAWTTNRWLGLATAALAIGLLLVGIRSREWLRGVDVGIETHLGLRTVELCQDVESTPGERSRSCEEVTVTAMTTSAFAPAGAARFATLAAFAFWSGLVATGLLALCVVLGLSNRPVDLPIHPTSLAILASVTALGAGAVTMALNPYTGLVGWGSGRGFVLYGLGAGLGLFAAIVLGRARPAVPSEFD